MNILQEIIAKRIKDVEARKELVPVKMLEQSIFFDTKPVSLKKYLLRPDKSGIIAEIKRQSPSKGLINKYVSIERTSIGYMQAGASALSVLTEPNYFGGSNEDLTEARRFNFCPILRKDFMIDEYQVLEAKSIGADAVLLLAGILESTQIANLAKVASNLGMEVLIESGDQNELEKALDIDYALVGVNSRNLKTFEVNLDTARELGELIPSDRISVAESGINNPEDVLQLMDAGYKGFLIGGYFMQHDRPETACKQFIDRLKKLKQSEIDQHG